MKLKKEILDNGIFFYKLKISNLKTILFSVNVKIGSIYEDKNVRGISHFLEHMMFRSNKKYSSDEISEGLELNGGIANGFTYTFLTSYFVETFPSNFSKILDIFYSMFENEKYNEKEFEIEKRVVISEIERMERNPEELLIEKLIPLSVYGKSDYGDPIIGYRETIESISKEDLEEFKFRYYTSNNIFIFIAGNFSNKHLELIRKKFSRLEERKVKKKKPTKFKGKDIIERFDTKNQIYYAKNFELDIKKLGKSFHIPFAFSEIISGGISSLLFKIFRKKYGIGYHLFFEPITIYEDKMILSLVIPGYEKEKDKYIDLAFDELMKEINKKNFENYVEGRKNLVKLKKYEKIRSNLSKRIMFEIPLIYLKEESFDCFYSKIFKTSAEKIVNFTNSLMEKEYRITKLIPTS